MDISNFTMYDGETFDDTRGVYEINFTNKDLSNVNIGSLWITDCYFKNNIIENYTTENRKYFSGDTGISDSSFIKTKFINIEIYQMEIDEVLFENCTFEHVLFNYTALMNCTFKNCTFKNCTFKNAFSFSEFNDVNFENCEFSGDYEFSHCSVNNLKFKNVVFDTERAVSGVNVGTFDNRIILDEDESYKYFVKHSRFVDCDIKDPKLIEAIAMYPKKDNVETQNSQPELG